MWRSIRAALVIAAITALSSTLPNSSVAASEAVSTGGLSIAPHPHLRVEAVRVTISSDEIVSSYEIRNTSGRDESALAAFAMPEVDRHTFGDDPAAVPQDTINFTAASANADGRPVSLTAQQRATALGLDVTHLLRSAGLGLFPASPSLAAEISALTADSRLDFRERGILSDEDGEFHPNWTLHTTAYWRQIFAAGRLTKLELAYSPLAGVATARSEVVGRAIDSHCLGKPLADDLMRRAATASPSTLTFVGYHLSGAAVGEPSPRQRILIKLPENANHAATCAGRLEPAGDRLLELSGLPENTEIEIQLMFAN